MNRFYRRPPALAALLALALVAATCGQAPDRKSVV